MLEPVEVDVLGQRRRSGTTPAPLNGENDCRRKPSANLRQRIEFMTFSMSDLVPYRWHLLNRRFHISVQESVASARAKLPKAPARLGSCTSF
jgi:hypothetical protein